MTLIPPNHLSRRALIGGIVACVASPAFAARRAPVVLNGANTRKIHMYASPTGEVMDTVYWADGEYIKPVLEEINYFMRDWRAGRAAEIDPSLIDLIAAMQTHLDTAEPFNLLSAYRTEATNQILRRRSRGVAKQSYHVKARAVDLRMKGRTTRQIQKAALAVAVGGVGRYRRSGFVHVDTGPIRKW